MDVQATLPNLSVFIAAYELGSFTRAAKHLGITPQAASRGVLRLEEALGATLFRRTTRVITPTDAARVYYQGAKEALLLLARAEDEAHKESALRAGRVRVSAPTSYAHHRLLPAVAAFRERYPGIELDLHVGNRNVDFAAEGYDFAIRMGEVRDPNLVVKKLGDFPLGTFAAPTYLAKHGAPRTPADLVHHTCIAFEMPRTGRVLPWSFSPEPSAWTPPSAVCCSEDVLATVALARAGVGLLQTYDFLVDEDLSRGTLVEVLAAHRGASRPFSIVYPRTPKRSAAARELIAFVSARARAA